MLLAGASASAARGGGRRGRRELAAARAQLARALDALADRLVEIYRGGMPDATTLLLEADGFDDLATRAEYLRRIEEADAALVARVRVLRDSVREQLAAVEDAEQRVAGLQRADRRRPRPDRRGARRGRDRRPQRWPPPARAGRRRSRACSRRSADWTAEVQRLERISAEQAQREVADWFGDWAIPESIVMCESGGNFDAVNPSSGAGGAYQILPSTWELYGGEGDPEDASPGRADRRSPPRSGPTRAPSAWVCAG